MTDAMLPLPALSPFSGKTVVAKFDGCESFRQVPKRIMLDIGDTFDAVHGAQQLRPFNAANHVLEDASDKMRANTTG